MLSSLEMGCTRWCWVMHAVMLSLVGNGVRGRGAWLAACARGVSAINYVVLSCAKGVSACELYVPSCPNLWNPTLESALQYAPVAMWRLLVA